MVLLTRKVDALAGLVGRAGGDVGGPAVHRLRAASSRTVWFAPLVKEGASLTAVTVIVKRLVGAGVDAAVGGAAVVLDLDGDGGDAVGVGRGRVGQVPARHAGCVENSALLSLLTTKSNPGPTRWPGPARVGGPAGDRLGAGVLVDRLVGALGEDGASLTAVTVIVKVWSAPVSMPPLAVPPSSWTAR